MDLPEGKKLYFASDNHLGAPTAKESRIREEKFVAWLKHVRKDAAVIFLLGDLFDFWFEYQHVVPKGFVRVLGELASIRDEGIPVCFFVGNHDLWMKDYFHKELDIPVFHEAREYTFNNKDFYIAHGDGLGPGDKGYKRMKKLFVHPWAKWLYRWLHPDLGMPLAQYFSVRNKLISGEEDMQYMGEDREWLVQYSKEKLEERHRDFFVFGHRHLPLEIPLNDSATYVNVGDWVNHYTYGIFEGDRFEIRRWE